MMKTTLGEDWKDFFGLKLARVKKPLFHRAEEPIWALDENKKKVKYEVRFSDILFAVEK
jgi:hypothetical protein